MTKTPATAAPIPINAISATNPGAVVAAGVGAVVLAGEADGVSDA